MADNNASNVAANTQNLLTNTQFQQLSSQIINPQGYPNIPAKRYFSVERLLKSAISLSYGVSNTFTGLPAPTALNSGQYVDFLVLAVQGAAPAPLDTNPTTDPKVYYIFLANRACPAKVNLKPTTPSFTLSTPLNVNIPVTVKKVLSNGTLQINEPITQDVQTIFSTPLGHTAYPYLRVDRYFAYKWGFK